MKSAILNFYFRSGHTVFPMCHLDRFSKTFPKMYYKLYYSLSKVKILVVDIGNHPLGTQRRKISWVFGGLSST